MSVGEVDVEGINKMAAGQGIYALRSKRDRQAARHVNACEENNYSTDAEKAGNRY